MMPAANAQQPKPGLVIEVQGLDLDREGRGIGRWQGWVIVVADLLPGETAEVKLQQRRKSRWFAQRLTLLHCAESRRRPPCILASDCGGCTLQHLDDAAQLDWKQGALEETLRRIGRIECPTRPALTNAHRHLGYRNRTWIPLARNEQARLRLGYYKRASHRIVNLNHCPVLDPRLDALIQPLKQDLDQSGWPADHDLLHGGGLRHLGLRLAHHTGEILITLVSSHRELPGLQSMAERWLARWPKVRGVTFNMQPKRNNLVLGPQTRLIAGEAVIDELFCGHKLQLSTTTFFQVNTPQAEAIVKEICTLLKHFVGNGRVIDAYCGIGTISLPVAAIGFEVLGLEVNASSVKQAQINAAANQLQHSCRFEAGEVGDLLGQYLPTCDVLIVDPPRKGLEAAALQSITSCPPQWIVYLSCDPATQARDLKLIQDAAVFYEIRTIQPVDFFPQTSHLENLIFMQKCDNNQRPVEALID